MLVGVVVPSGMVHLTSAFASSCGSLTWSGLLPALVLALTSRNCILPKEFRKLLYQATFQSQISHTPVGAWPSLTWLNSCPGIHQQVQRPYPTRSHQFRLLLSGAVAQPCLIHPQTQLVHGSAVPRPSSTCPTPILALMSTSRFCSLAQSVTLQTQATPMPREVAVMSSLVHRTHSSSHTQQSGL